MMQKIKVSAPATVANLSCGFDVMGLAVENPSDVVELELTSSDEVHVKKIIGDNGVLPLEAEKNTAGVAILCYLKHIQKKVGVAITLHKNLPLGSGMGSSAASAVAAVVAINELCGAPLTRKELLPFVMEAERIACGAAHADNVAPSLLGGLVLIRQYEPLDIIQIPAPSDLMCVLVHPELEVKTRDARKVLKPTITLKEGITQWGNTAALVAGMLLPDYPLIGRALTDVVAEPIRSILIPDYYVLKKTATDNGALGCGISGSGPTLFCLCQGKDKAEQAGKALQVAFQKMNIHSQLYLSKINQVGATVLPH